MAGRFPFTDDEDFSTRGTRWSTVAGTAAVAAGASWLGRKHVDRDPRTLSYLNEGLQGRTVGSGLHAFNTPTLNWWEIANRPEGKVRISDIALNYLKSFEESFGTIPRTFDLFALGSRSLTAPTGQVGTRLAFDATYTATFRPHLEKLVGRPLSAVELAHGFELREYDAGKNIFGRPKTEVGLFSAVAGPNEAPALARARTMQRFWAPPGVSEESWHRSRLAATYQRVQGSSAVPAAFVEKGRATRGSISSHPFLITGGKNRMQDWGRLAHAVGTEVSARYFRLLDDPVEVIEDFIRGTSSVSDSLLQKAGENKYYKSFIRNRFGVGGAAALEGSNMMQLWGKHIKHAGPLVLGLGAAYAGLNALTTTVADQTPYQIGTRATANAQLMATRVSDVTGLTSLAKWQESEAPGSTSIPGVLAFPAAGGIAGYVAGAVEKRATAEGWAWRAIRQQNEELPGFLKWMNRLTGTQKYTRASKWGLVGAAIGGALSLPFLPGALGSTKSADELAAEMSGVQEVAVKKGRFWEMGRTPYEGGATMYHRPNYFARSQIDAREKGLYGEYANKPITRFFKGLTDPYWLEKMHYHDRPYPVTGPDDTGWGPLGTIWSATLGSILKPAKIMHDDELGGGFPGYGAGGASVAEASAGTREASAELGGGPGSAAISPYSAEYQVGELAYRTQEAIGLPGFIYGAVKKHFTGSADIFDDKPVLASATDMASDRRGYWDMQIGGAATASEAYRRWNPSKRFQIEEHNPLRNTMPSWMPGDNYYVNFKQGDPYAAIPEGELRLPGEGYAAQHPELEGIHPENYPAAYRMSILGDVAPYSKEYGAAKEQVQSMAAMGALTTKEQELAAGAMSQVAEIKRGREFESREDDRGLFGSYWQTLKRAGRALPTEHLFPFSPVHKFSGETDVVSAYADERVYSTDYPSWGRPFSQFIRPSVDIAAADLGFDAIPGPEEERRGIQEYFDMLEYVKQRNLQARLSDEGAGRAAFRAARDAENTTFGADPFGRSSALGRVLDKRDRDYIMAMMDLKTPGEQKKALDLVPHNVRPMLEAQYMKKLYVALAAQDDRGSEQEMIMDRIEELRATENQVATNDMAASYVKAKTSGKYREGFADFIRMRRTQAYFEDNPLPGADWVGWRDDVDLEDVKLKMVVMEGRDFHDFGGWESQVRDLSRKPYLEEAVGSMIRGAVDSDSQIFKMLSSSGHRGVSISSSVSSEDQTNVVISQNNQGAIRSVLQRMGLGD